MDREQRAAVNPELLEQLLKSVEKPEELLGPDGLLHRLKGALMERMLEAEMATHLGYEPNEAKGRNTGNSRNGHSSKTVQTESGPVEIRVPRDRQGSFEPQLIPKHQRRLEGFDDKVLALYSRGMSTRDIKGHLRELYGTEVSADLISRVTDAVLDEVKAWQARPLDAVYPIVYLDALFVSIRDGGRVTKKAVYIALGVGLDGTREVLGFWIDATEGARFWLTILTELKNRGVEDIFFVCCDGLTGLPQAIEAAFPKAVVQTCIVHMIRSSLRYVTWPDRKAVAAALRPVYAAENEEAAQRALAVFEERWGTKYPTIAKQWRARWSEIVPFLAYPREIRRVLYTTNTIESLNFQLRKVLKPKGHFPTDEAVAKILYLALQHAKVHWKPPIFWRQAIAHFSIVFGRPLPRLGPAAN
jgi:putative transposase